MVETPTSESLKNAIAEIEARAEPFSEHEVGDAFRCLRKKDDPSPRLMEWVAEVMAFEFTEDYPNGETGRGTYFGPVPGTNEDGSRCKSPSQRLVTAEMLDYWSRRARECRHPILKARYAGVVWDFTKLVTSRSPAVEMARIRIDSVVDAAAPGRHQHPIIVIKQLRHALQLAIKTNDLPRVEKVRDTILAHADKVGEDNKAGLWCFVYDSLWNQKKVPLTIQQQTKIIGDLEGRLERLADTTGQRPIDPWSAEAAAVRLAKHYRAKNRPHDVKRVLLKYGAAFEKIAESAAAMLAQAWFQQVHRVYHEFGLKDDAERLLRRIRELGPKALSDLKPISAEVTITKEQMDGYVQAMTEGDLEASLGRIAGHYLPRKDQVEKQLRDLAGQAMLSFLFQTQIMDHEGRPTASVGSTADDPEGRIAMQMAQNMQFEAVFLRQVMIALVKKFSITHETLTEYVCRAPLFGQDGGTILSRGIKAYLEGDPLVAIHVLIPQIENAIRTLIEAAGGTVLKPNRSGGMDLKIFDELLGDGILSSVFGDNVPLYLGVLFTNRRGVNLRNLVFHGIAPASIFNLAFADRVVHCLLILAQVRKNEKPRSGEQEGGGLTDSPTLSGDQEQCDG